MQIKLTAILAALLLDVATAGLLPRDTATILNDLTVIDGDIAQLTAAFNAFTGDLGQALATQELEQKLEADIDKATADTQATPALSTGDSTSVTNALLGLEPDIKQSLDAIVAKKPEVDMAGVGSLVLSDLHALQTKTDALSSALQNIATSTDKTAIASGTAKIDASFASAIAVFS